MRESGSLTVAIDLYMQKRYHGLPVLNDDGRLTGIITVQDIDRIQGDSSDTGMHTVGEVCTRELLLAYPDGTIRAALRRIRVEKRESIASRCP
ncbi:MAG: CBS domain-containing protein [Planctomycetia bacterium]|nr:CBS domain-containing protein [Planctomycetia bacterium]